MGYYEERPPRHGHRIPADLAEDEILSAVHGDFCGMPARPEQTGPTSRSECLRSTERIGRKKKPKGERAMTTQTAEAPGAESMTSPAKRGFRHLFRPNTSFNLLLAIENDDNARAAIRVTDALTARGAVPTVVRATEVMVPVAGTPDSMMVYAEAVLGEDFHQTQVHSLRALITATLAHARPWPIKSVTGDPARCITEEAEAQNAELLVMGIHRHGIFEQAIGENTATRVMGRSVAPVLGVRPSLTGLPRRIMVPTDFGNASREAAHLAANLADPGGCVILVHSSLPAPIVDEGDEGLALIQREGIEHAFLHLTDEISEGKTIRVETVSRTGDAGAQLMASAALISPDLIAIASQRHHLITRMILGSVTRMLVREGGWPMLITSPMRTHPGV
jgi:nucleotide-binding universal stress UspA family protein